MRGVNLASWFYPEPWSNGEFFDAAGEPRAKTIEELANRMGQELFRKHYKKNLENWLNPDLVFAHLKSLGINAVRIPVPEQMILPVS